MAVFPETEADPVWAQLLAPDEQAVQRMRYASDQATTLAACGVSWDAVVVAPLQRGLAALDVLGLPVDGGYPVLADYTRCELIAQVTAGTGAACADLPGVRVLARGAWLLVPTGPHGAYCASWLSAPDPFAERYVDALALRTAVLAADAGRAELARAR
jgi:hypothetical protein